MSRTVAVSIMCGLFAVAGALAGCGSSGGSSGTAAGGSETTGGSGGNLTIGVSIPAGSQTYWNAVERGAKDQARKEGVTLNIVDAKGDANTQNEQLNQLGIAGADGVILATVDAAANVVGATSPTLSEIPVDTMNRMVETEYGGPKGANPRINTGLNDIKIGNAQGELIEKGCQGKDPCEIIYLNGEAGSSTQIEREKGMLEVVEGNPSIKILATESNDFDPGKTEEVTQSLLQRFPHVDMLVVSDDASAIGAVRAVKKAGRLAEIKITGVGGNREGIKAIKNDEMYASVWVSPDNEGAQAVKAIVEIIKDGNVAGLEEINGRPGLINKDAVVTKANADQYPPGW